MTNKTVTGETTAKSGRLQELGLQPGDNDHEPFVHHPLHRVPRLVEQPRRLAVECGQAQGMLDR